MQFLAAVWLCGSACQQVQAQAIPTPAPNVPELKAQLVTPVIKTVHDGATIKIKTGILLTNEGSASAKNVTIAAYLSDDGTLSADDTTLATFQLSTFKNKGNLKVGKSFTVPLPYKIPAAFADALQGKYLIFVTAADNFTADATNGEVVFGPITLP